MLEWVPYYMKFDWKKNGSYNLRLVMMSLSSDYNCNLRCAKKGKTGVIWTLKNDDIFDEIRVWEFKEGN